MIASEFQKKVWFNALTAVCIVVLGSLMVGGIWLLGEVLAYLQPVLVPLAVAGILAYLIDPIVNWTERKGLSRMKAILAVFVLGAISIGGFSAMIAVPVSNQAKKLNENKGEYMDKAKKMFSEIGKIDGLVEALPSPLQKIFPNTAEKVNAQEDVMKSLELPSLDDTTILTDDLELVEEVVSPSLTQEAARHLNAQKAVVVEPEEIAKLELEKKEKVDWVDLLSLEKILDSLQKNAPGLAQRVAETITRGASKFFGIIGYALGFILVPVYLFFFLKESVVIQKNWRRFVPLRASNFKDEVVDVVAEINDYLIAFFRGQILVSVIDGFLVGLVLKFFGHPFAILIGIALAVLGVIPFIGNIICMVPAAVTAYAHFSIESEQNWIGSNPWMYVLMVLAIFIVVQQINSLVTAPKIVGESVGLHPMTVIFSMLFWSLLLGGFLGALLAVPLTASVKVLFRRYIWQRQVMPEDGELFAKA